MAARPEDWFFGTGGMFRGAHTRGLAISALISEGNSISFKMLRTVLLLLCSGLVLLVANSVGDKELLPHLANMQE